jgi:drug/metabolite transporter (DMT)-like permease
MRLGFAGREENSLQAECKCGLIEAMSALHRKWTKDAGPVAALLLLCFLWSVDSLRSDFAPGAMAGMPPFSREGLHLSVFALVAAALALLRRAAWPKGRQVWDSVLIGLGLFVPPALLSVFPDDTMPDLTRVVLFSLAPVFAVVFEPYLGRLAEPQSKWGLMAALGCVIGTLGVFPLYIPRNLPSAAAFFGVIVAVACIAAANCWAVRCVSSLPRGSGTTVAAIAAFAAAAVLIVAGALGERRAWRLPSLAPELVWSAVIELPALLLLFWLMRRMSAVRMTTRFVVAPLIVNVLGLLALRPMLTLRAGLGLLLTAIGAGWLLSAREDDGELSPLPLKLNQG